MSIDPHTPDVDPSDLDYDELEEHEATGEGMPQSPDEIADGTAE